MNISQNYLKSILSYNHATGALHWKISRGKAKAGDVAGWVGSVGHRFMKILDVETTASRFVWLYFYGIMPTTYLEHINGNKLDDRIENLRIPIDYSDLQLTAERLRAVLNYDPDTGIFTWRRDTSKKTRGKHSGFSNDQGYLLIGVDGHKYRIHRLAWFYIHGKWPAHHIDHINGNRADNRLSNLREAEVFQNMANSRRPITNKSGYKGVSWHAGARKWQVHIKYQDINSYLGLFESAEEGHAVYCAEAIRLKGKFAKTD